MSLWGTEISSTPIFRGCRSIICDSKRFGIRSGLVITARVLKTNPLFEKLRSYKKIDLHYCLGRYYFENVNMTNMLDVLLDDESLKKLYPAMSVEDVRNYAYRMLLKYNSDFYIHVTGKDISVFESKDILRKLTHSNPAHFFIDRGVAPHPTNYVPLGQVLILSKNGHGNTFNFLAPNEDYKLMQKNSYIPIDVEKYEEYKKTA